MEGGGKRFVSATWLPTVIQLNEQSMLGSLLTRSMPKSKKRKYPVTLTDSGQPSGSSSTPQSSRNLIRQFHVLLKRKAFHQKSGSLRTADDEIALKAIEQEMELLGGLAAYQRMSSIGQGDDRQLQ